MVAYSFQPALRTLSSTAARAARSAPIGDAMHGRGEQLQIDVGTGTKQCLLITRKICVAMDPISLDFVARGSNGQPR
jgi:hypothetical protein